jgi:hypothetical protein
MSHYQTNTGIFMLHFHILAWSMPKKLPKAHTHTHTHMLYMHICRDNLGLPNIVMLAYALFHVIYRSLFSLHVRKRVHTYDHACKHHTCNMLPKYFKY